LRPDFLEDIRSSVLNYAADKDDSPSHP